MEVDGRIVCVLSASLFRVEMNNQRQVLATISSKIWKRWVRFSGPSISEAGPWFLFRRHRVLPALLPELPNKKVCPKMNAPTRKYRRNIDDLRTTNLGKCLGFAELVLFVGGANAFPGITQR